MLASQSVVVVKQEGHMAAWKTPIWPAAMRADAWGSQPEGLDSDLDRSYKGRYMGESDGQTRFRSGPQLAMR